MAVDFKAILVDGFLELCNSTPLSRVTIKDLLNKTGVSKQTFYNHFSDKNDLIVYIYLSRIIPKFKIGVKDLDYYESVKEDFERFAKYHKFLKQACMLTGQNCMTDFMIDYCIKFDLEWLKALHGDKPLTKEQIFASKYHSMAAMNMAIAWILSDMPTSPDEMARQITTLRRYGLGPLFDKAATAYSLSE